MFHSYALFGINELNFFFDFIANLTRFAFSRYSKLLSATTYYYCDLRWNISDEKLITTTFLIDSLIEFDIYVVARRHKTLATVVV